MTKAIFLKEWIKTRLVFFVALVAALAFAAYACFKINTIVVGKGIDHVWLIMLMKDQTFVDVLKYLPLALGIAVGAAQMAPEMTQKRLKLTLHLPYPQNRLILAMLATGLVELLFIFALQAVCIATYYSTLVTASMANRVLLTMVPWYIVGLSAYLFTAALCLEGTWRRRVILALLGVGVIMPYFAQPAPEAYNSIIFVAVIFTLLLIFLTYNSVYRFKEGKQD